MLMNKRLKEWRQEKLQQYKIFGFWYFAHIDNLNHILEHGIIPKNEVEKRGLSYSSFADENVQALRDKRHIYLTNHQRVAIHDLVPVYLCPRTPTLFKRKNSQSHFLFVLIKSFILLDDGIEFAFSNGNAASHETRFFCDLDRLSELPWDVIKASSWTEFPDGKRQRNTEFLIYPKIPTSRFWEIGVCDQSALANVKQIVGNKKIDTPVSIRKDWFF